MYTATSANPSSAADANGKPEKFPIVYKRRPKKTAKGSSFFQKWNSKEWVRLSFEGVGRKKIVELECKVKYEDGEEEILTFAKEQIETTRIPIDEDMQNLKLK